MKKEFKDIPYWVIIILASATVYVVFGLEWWIK